MIVSFELTMPNRGSWNGKWSGENNKYYVIRNFLKSSKSGKKIIELLSRDGELKNGLLPSRGFYYRWDDGWGANVQVEIIDASEAKKRRKISKGFCGYEWMISSILNKGKILI